MVFITVGKDVFCQSVFRETALEWGIEHYHHGAISGTTSKTMGGGVAIFDFNNDGFEDIYLTGGLHRDELFKNNGNRTFTPVGQFSGFAITSDYATMSVTAGDINNDGLKDLFVGTERGKGSLFFINNGDNTFSEISEQANISTSDWAMGATFGDFNLDGYIDIYVLNYIQEERLSEDDNGLVNGFDHDCYPNKLYLNNGDLTFTEVGNVSSTNNAGCGLAIAATDLNNDQIPDLYMANDFGEWIIPNTCLINNYPDQQFTDLSTVTGLNAAIYGMGIAVGDYNRDGFLDYYVSNLGSNVLYRNERDGTYNDKAEVAGVLNTYSGERFATSWGTAFFDYDLDGFEDLFVSNGHVPAAGFIGTALEDPNKLYKNRGDGTFEDVSVIEGLDDPKIGRGMAVGDLDNDGDPDLVVAVVDVKDNSSNVLVYENMQETGNRWLKVMVKGKEANYDGYGAKVKAYHDGIVWLHEIDGGSSHVSHNSSIAHFGLGNVETIDSLIVIWPGGETQKFGPVNTDQTVVIEESANQYLVAGCMNALAGNFEANATFDWGCFFPVEGCLDQESPNFSIEANVESGDCIGVITAVKDSRMNELTIYPNPMTDFVYIELPETFNSVYNLQLLDLSGKTLREVSFKRKYELKKESLKSGIYLIRISTKNQVITRKVIIK